MVPQGRCQLFVVFFLALLPCSATAQSSAPAVFIPFGAPTEYAAPQATTGFTTPTSPYVVARRVSQPCSSCPQSSSLAGGEMPSYPQPSCNRAYYPVTGQTGCSNYGNEGYGNVCPPTNYLQAKPRAVWYASAAGLYLSRSEPRRVWTTYENNNNSNQLMSTQDADTDFEVGADLRIGRCLAGNRWVVELGYWSIDNFDGSASQSHANEVSSPLQFNDLEFAPGDPVVDYFDSAADHRVYRSNELHNLEINLIEGQAASSGCSPWSHQMLVGVRYFKFDEDITFDTLNSGGTWGGNGGLDEVRLRDSIQNDLIGVQVGCIFQRRLGCKTRFVVTPKFGIYNNHIENRFDLRRGDGTAAVPSAASGVTGSYPVESSTDVVSFLSEANVGLQYQASCRWSLYGGYRVVAITGMGLADEQIPQFIIDIPEIADIDSNGSLVLHGAYFGATRSF